METDNLSEEILEFVWKATEEQGRHSISVEELPANIGQQHLLPLLNDNLAVLEDDCLTLTPSGRQRAASVVRRHRLAERLLRDVLDVGRIAAEASACSLEHILHAEVEEKICILLGHPRSCPHGKPIPWGTCCVQNIGSNLQLVSPLANLVRGDTGRIAYLHTGAGLELQKFLAMGMVPGVWIEVLRTYPAYVIRMGNSEFAVDEHLAKGVFLRMENANNGSPESRGNMTARVSDRRSWNRWRRRSPCTLSEEAVE